MKQVAIVIPAAAVGDRLDRFVAGALDVARNQVQQWIADGLVTLGGKPAKASTRVEADDRVEVRIPPPPDPRIEPEEGPVSVVWEDEHLLAVDKPPGLTVHPGAGRPTGTLVHRLLGRYPEIAGVGGPGRPGIVHRLDKDTSGLLLVARTPLAYRGLSRAFSSRDVEKRYLAVVYGDPGEAMVDAPIGRHPVQRKRMVVRQDGRPAHSVFRTRERGAGVSLVEVEIETGRTHQIRVHAKHLGHPLVGDPVYGEARWKALPSRLHGLLRGFPRPALHAWKLSLDHPVSGERLSLEAPVPEDLQELWEGAGGQR
jgi:23S rRNA pseudouridine1911/1915/1917 synthase